MGINCCSREVRRRVERGIIRGVFGRGVKM